MTVYGLMASVLWAAVALAALHKADQWVSKVLARWVQHGEGPEQIRIPNDLMALSNMESEIHAQESVRDAILEAWERYKDWNKVRTALGVGTIDEESA
jgi:hypothetical protein